MSKENKKKHILVISQYFYPEPFRINDICQEWVKRGYHVTVLTGIPNYPQGKFYPGYGIRKKREEEWNGIHIIRIPLIPRGHTPIGMILNYFSFPIRGWFWNLRNKFRADYVFMYETSPMTQCKIGVWYKKKHHVPLYLYAQDLWPENVEVITGIHHPLVINPIQKMVDKIYQHCDEIFVTSPSFKETVLQRNQSKEKVHVLPQYAEEFYQPTAPSDMQALSGNYKFRIVFTGNIGYAQGLDILPKTAQILKERNITNVSFVIVGDGRYKEQLKKEISTVPEMFCLIPRRPAEDIPAILSACDVAFLSFQDNPLWEKTIPAKLQSYMACGKPVLAYARGETDRILREAECGRCVTSGGAEALADTIIELQQNPEALTVYGKHSREYYLAHFEKQKIMNQLEEYLR